MSAPYETLAETLEPPFVAAIISDTAIVSHLTECERRPSDEMVSLAPAQSGFLGLETTKDDNGRWISVSYWQDMTAFNTWRGTCAERIASVFPEAPLESLCHIRVANVDEPVKRPRNRHLRADEPVPTSSLPSTRTRSLLNVIPSIAGLFGHVHAR
ncbi:MAG: hypothetical protein HOH04_16575 [Rhodospirillaceae bacterium]|jgi:hypothetical protein|nr:hypothetical protein [Rhodospirillaceae bacterium]